MPTFYFLFGSFAFGQEFQMNGLAMGEWNL
jgi:hypothetical protein